MAELTLDEKRVEDVAVLSLRGYVNAHTVKEFETRLQELAESCPRLVVNGRDLTYIASAGLGALMGVIEEVRSRRGDIRLAALSESVYGVFDILGFTHVFRIYGDEDEALRSFREDPPGEAR